MKMSLLQTTKRRMMPGLIALVGVSVLAGCSSNNKREVLDEFAAARPTYHVPPPQQNGAIFQSGYGISLFEDNLARRVGDVLTIVLEERTNASKSAATSTSKDSAISQPSPTLLGGGVRFALPRPFGNKLQGRTLENNVESTNSFAGEGDSSLSNSLTGNITVTVAEVLPNGNLFVRGQKQLTINQGDEYVQITGIVRPSDINPDNTVISTRVADARIAYIGEGTLADANTQGWLGKFFSSKWWPF